MPDESDGGARDARARRRLRYDTDRRTGGGEMPDLTARQIAVQDLLDEPRDGGDRIQLAVPPDVPQLDAHLLDHTPAQRPQRVPTGPAFTVQVPDLFEAWGVWCAEEGRDNIGTKSVFSRDLHAAVPGVTTSQLQVDGERFRSFNGIDLTPAAKGSLAHARATKETQKQYQRGRA